MSQNLLPVFIAAFALLLIGGILAFAFVEGLPAGSTQTAGSYSIIGHHAWCSLLREFDFEVRINRTVITPYPDMPSVLYLAPDAKETQDFLHQTLAAQIEKILAAAGTVCVACPKWRGRQDWQNPGWIGDKELIDSAEIVALCGELGVTVELSRLDADASANVEIGDDTLPVAADNLQLLQVRGNADTVYGLNPLAVSGQGIFALSCQVGPGRLIIVADPDIFTNQGLAQADNGLVALRLAEQIAPARKLIIDEVAHGLGKDFSVLKLIVSYPYVVATLQVIALLVCLLLPVARPFFPPLPEPTWERSREEQIKSIAQITYAAGHHRHFLEKYLRSVVKQMHDNYPALASMEWAAQLEYLDQIAKQKNIPYSLKAIYDKVRVVKQPQDMERLVRKIYNYKQKLLARPA